MTKINIFLTIIVMSYASISSGIQSFKWSDFVKKYDIHRDPVSQQFVIGKNKVVSPQDAKAIKLLAEKGNNQARLVRKDLKKNRFFAGQNPLLASLLWKLKEEYGVNKKQRNIITLAGLGTLVIIKKIHEKCADKMDLQFTNVKHDLLIKNIKEN